MRVLQLIDSLEAGGAERVSVNIANALVNEVEKSFLCATRKEGVLKDSLNKKVGYLFLNKKSRFSLKTIIKLNKFIKHNHINIIHAHSTSFFLATIIKLLNKKIKIVWHDHYGNSEFLIQRKSKVLRYCSKYFYHILSVNKALEKWAKENLKSKQISYFPNFAVQDKVTPQTNLQGEEGKRIVHMANLRLQKDHSTLIEGFKILIKNHPEWTLHCVGKDFGDTYSKSIKRQIEDLDNAFFYGSKPDVSNILNQSNIAVLSSKSEGLPLTLLEYGLASLPTVSTDVGDCRQVISNKDIGVLIESENPKEIAMAISSYINNVEERRLKGKTLEAKVLNCFSKTVLIKDLLAIYNLKS